MLDWMDAGSQPDRGPLERTTGQDHCTGLLAIGGRFYHALDRTTGLYWAAW